MMIATQPFNSTEEILALQSSFAGGMNLVYDDTTLNETEYRLAFNVRNRFNKLKPIKNPKNVTYNLTGKLQGIYSVGSYWIVFSSGRCFYREHTATHWTQVPGFQMSESADKLYAIFVEGSFANYLRKLPSGATSNSVVDKLNTQISATPRAMLVQDGINQPWIITLLEDGTPSARQVKTYAEWEDGREYVPIGLDMMLHDGILYVVSADRKKLYRSVTGRPLDFVVNVDEDGNRGGDADTTFYTVDYGNITAIFPLNTDAFLVSTDNPATYLVTPLRESGFTIFGEPTFRRELVMNSTVLNSHSIVNILGDTSFVDAEGIKSFNAVMQLRNEGRNSVFSLKIAPLFENVKQDITAAISFDNYAIFSVKTKYGYMLVTFDELNKVFCSLESTEAVKIKQFVNLNPFVNTVGAITENNEVFELYASAEYAIGQVYTKSWTSDNPRISQRASGLHAIFTEPVFDGSAKCKPYVDGRRVSVIEKDIKKVRGGVVFPVEYPVTFTNISSVNNITFKFVQPLQGWKISYVLTWQGGATLNHILHTGISATPKQSLQQSSLYAS